MVQQGAIWRVPGQEKLRPRSYGPLCPLISVSTLGNNHFHLVLVTEDNTHGGQQRKIKIGMFRMMGLNLESRRLSCLRSGSALFPQAFLFGSFREYSRLLLQPHRAGRSSLNLFSLFHSRPQNPFLSSLALRPCMSSGSLACPALCSAASETGSWKKKQQQRGEWRCVSPTVCVHVCARVVFALTSVP